MSEELWDKDQEAPQPEPCPISKEQALSAAMQQVDNWRARGHSVSDDDRLIEARVAYQLLSDQAKLFADIIERIQSI